MYDQISTRARIMSESKAQIAVSIFTELAKPHVQPVREDELESIHAGDQMSEISPQVNHLTGIIQPPQGIWNYPSSKKSKILQKRLRRVKSIASLNRVHRHKPQCLRFIHSP